MAGWAKRSSCIASRSRSFPKWFTHAQDNYRIEGVNDIMRVNFSEFLVRMDDPKKPLWIANGDDVSRGVRRARLPHQSDHPLSSGSVDGMRLASASSSTRMASSGSSPCWPKRPPTRGRWPWFAIFCRRSSSAPLSTATIARSSGPRRWLELRANPWLSAKVNLNCPWLFDAEQFNLEDQFRIRRDQPSAHVAIAVGEIRRMISLRLPPTFIVATPSSPPAMT